MPKCSRSNLVAAAILVAWTVAAANAAEPPLIRAVKDGDVETVRVLLREPIEVNGALGDGSTALHWAAHNDDVAMAEVLIRAGAKAEAATDLGTTPLHLACTNRNAAMVDLLLSAGGHANAALLNGETVLMTCARTGNPQAVKALLLRGAHVNAKESGHDQTAVMWAAAQGHADAVRLLVEAGADLRARSKIYPVLVAPYETQRAGREEMSYTVLGGGLTPLFFAARSGDVGSARALVDGGANPNDHLPDGTSPLVMAAYSGHGDVGALLLEKGADPNDAAAGYTPLHAAILRSNLGLVSALLAHGANPNIRMTKSVPKRRRGEDFVMAAPFVGSTPYLLAARFLEPDILRALEAAGADVTLTMPNRATALMLAAGMDSIASESRRGVRTVDFGKVEPESRVLETVKAVFEIGADLAASNRTGDTALHTAAVLGHDSVIQYLVDRGAPINAKNARGLTPLGSLLAARKGRRPVAADGDDEVGAGSQASTPELLRRLGASE